MDGEQEVEEILKFRLGTIILAGHCCCFLPAIPLDGKSARATAEFFSSPLVVDKLPLPCLIPPTMFPLSLVSILAVYISSIYIY